MVASNCLMEGDFQFYRLRTRIALRCIATALVKDIVLFWHAYISAKPHTFKPYMRLFEKRIS